MQRRKRAALGAIDLLRTSFGSAATVLGTPPARRTRYAQLQIATARLDADPLCEHSRSLCGFANPSMALLASALRAVRQLSCGCKDGQYAVGIGVDLGLRKRAQEALHNLMSVVPIGADVADLAERDRLIRTLSEQLRQRLADDVDLGVLQLISAFSRQPRRAQWAIELMLRYSFSLWYGFFGGTQDVADTFLGVPIDDVYFNGPCWAPLGMTLLVNPFRDRLNLQASYLPDLIPTELAHEFLAWIRADAVQAEARP
jgi:hypothetical protein